MQEPFLCKFALSKFGCFAAGPAEMLNLFARASNAGVRWQEFHIGESSRRL